MQLVVGMQTEQAKWEEERRKLTVERNRCGKGNGSRENFGAAWGPAEAPAFVKTENVYSIHEAKLALRVAICGRVAPWGR